MPAFITNGRQDLLATDALARGFYTDVLAHPRRPANLACFAYLDAEARRFYVDWDAAAAASVQILRAEAGRDRALHDLSGELSTCSDEFRTNGPF